MFEILTKYKYITWVVITYIVDKEQLSLYLRYVDKKGMVKERLIGLVHMGNTSALILKFVTLFSWNIL